MDVVNADDVAREKVELEGAEKAWIRWLVGHNRDSAAFAMRVFELEPGGCTPYHSHSQHHEMFILEGTATLVGEGGERDVGPGTAVYVPGGEYHQVRNRTEGVLRFICCVSK